MYAAPRAPGPPTANVPGEAFVRNLPWLNLLLTAAIVAAVSIVAFRSGGGGGIEIEVRDPRPGIDEIRVDVSGAVLRPGVVTVAPGDRVVDAIALAGGTTADADSAAINLARRLVDQDHVAVPRLGERPPLLDVNHATATELEALPGIGPVYAAAVIAAREGEGAFVAGTAAAAILGGPWWATGLVAAAGAAAA